MFSGVRWCIEDFCVFYLFLGRRWKKKEKSGVDPALDPEVEEKLPVWF